jgi:hypothetical protein
MFVNVLGLGSTLIEAIFSLVQLGTGCLAFLEHGKPSYSTFEGVIGFGRVWRTHQIQLDEGAHVRREPES